MSSKRSATSQSERKPVPPPSIGALVRVVHQTIRRRQLSALVEHGFSDLSQEALLNVFVYPPPNGVRPSDLAARANMSKQAMNYLLGQLEAFGYVERRAEKGRSRRLVFLTPRGWQVFELQWAISRQFESEWAALVGKKT